MERVDITDINECAIPLSFCLSSVKLSQRMGLTYSAVDAIVGDDAVYEAAYEVRSSFLRHDCCTGSVPAPKNEMSIFETRFGESDHSILELTTLIKLSAPYRACLAGSSVSKVSLGSTPQASCILDQSPSRMNSGLAELLRLPCAPSGFTCSLE